MYERLSPLELRSITPYRPWRRTIAFSASPLHTANAAMTSCRSKGRGSDSNPDQGLALAHFSAQRKHICAEDDGWRKSVCQKTKNGSGWTEYWTSGSPCLRPRPRPTTLAPTDATVTRQVHRPAVRRDLLQGLTLVHFQLNLSRFGQ